MLLIAEIGNSNIVIAIRKNDELIHTFRYESKDNHPAAYYINGLQEVLLEWSIHPDQLIGSVVCSVVPHLNDAVRSALEIVTGKSPLLIGPSELSTLDMYVPKVYEIGSDLVANAYAALKLCGKHSLIVDFGTALSFTAVHTEEGIKGVTIAPGIKTAMSALSGNTAQLPEVWLDWPEKALGTTTDDAIRAGVLIGYRGLVKELISEIKRENPYLDNVIATGGMIGILNELHDLFDKVDTRHTLKGIGLMHDYLTTT